MANSDTASCSSSDEYEDAKDELGPLPDLSISQNISKGSSVNKENGFDLRSQKPLNLPRFDGNHLQPSTSNVILTPPSGLTSQLNKVDESSF